MSKRANRSLTKSPSTKTSRHKLVKRQMLKSQKHKQDLSTDFFSVSATFFRPTDIFQRSGKNIAFEKNTERMVRGDRMWGNDTIQAESLHSAIFDHSLLSVHLCENKSAFGALVFFHLGQRKSTTFESYKWVQHKNRIFGSFLLFQISHFLH